MSSSTLAVSSILKATSRPDVLRRIGLACPVMNSLQTELQFSQYQHQSTPVPSTDKVCSALRYRNMDPLGRRHEYTGGFPHEVSASDRYLMYAGGLMSPMQRCFSNLVCQPLMTSYVINAYLCLALFTPGPWSTRT